MRRYLTLACVIAAVGVPMAATFAQEHIMTTTQMCSGSRTVTHYMLQHRDIYSTDMIADQRRKQAEACGGGSKAAEIRNDAEQKALSGIQQQEAGAAIGEFILGVAIGAIGSRTPRGHVSTGAVRSLGVRTVTRSNVRVRTVNTRVPAPAMRQTTTVHTPTSVQSATTQTGLGTVKFNGNTSGVIGTITQPSDKQDAIYSKPCKLIQTGDASYDCIH